MHILSRQIKRKIDEAVAKYNVTAVQCSFIGIIIHESKNKDVYAKDIEAKFNMRRATVAEILSLMEKNGLVERHSNSKDGRLKKITLTKKSLEIQNGIEEEIKNVEDNLKNGLTKEEIEQCIKILNKMSKNLN